MSKSLEELPVSGGLEEHEEIIKDVAGIVFIGQYLCHINDVRSIHV